MTEGIEEGDEGGAEGESREAAKGGGECQGARALSKLRDAVAQLCAIRGLFRSTAAMAQGKARVWGMLASVEKRAKVRAPWSG